MLMGRGWTEETTRMWHEMSISRPRTTELGAKVHTDDDGEAFEKSMDAPSLNKSEVTGLETGI